MDAINTSQLTKFYGKSRGIVDFNLTVKKGDFFGCIGPNGAGKSTLIRSLLGLIRPTSGSASVLGLDIVKEKEAILRHVGYLPAEAMFYSGMRVKEILRFSAKLQKKDCTAEAQALCEALQLDRNKKIEELSLGNRKKVAIVCAMQHRPDLYLLDEPTSGLDPLMQRAFFELLRERHAQGATIFLSSHVLSEIQRHCNRAAIIRKGKIIACDDVEALSQTGAKRVTLHGVSDVPALADIRDVQVTHEGVSFLYSGRIRQLIRALSEMPLSDLTITEPDLEEIFLHYYEEGRERA